jgi:hypothetical protein
MPPLWAVAESMGTGAPQRRSCPNMQELLVQDFN